MAYYRQVLLLAVVAAVACFASPSTASATTGTVFVVGDKQGWRPNFTTTGWADDKTFRVNDTLLFVYNKEYHTVARVGKEDFAACNLQGNLIGGVLNSGCDVIALNSSGKMWFICTIPGHCDGGMKLVVDVQAAATEPPSSSAPLSYTVGGAVAAAGAVLAAVLAF